MSMLASLLIVRPAASVPINLITCLASEEDSIYKEHNLSAEYKLNQWFIVYFASATKMQLRPEYFQKICGNKSGNKNISRALLKEILTNGPTIFTVNSNENEAIKRLFPIDREELSGEVVRLFYQYLTDLQAKAATYDCLEKYIPEITYFSERFKFLESDLDTKNLISKEDLPKVFKIFTALDGIDEIYAKCTKDFAREQKLRRKADEAEAKNNN